jgi:hypothetical protein
MVASDITERRGTMWRFAAGLVLLFSPLLSPLFLLPYNDPLRRRYKLLGGIGVAALEVTSLLLLWGAARRLRGWRYIVTLALCCIAGVLALFFFRFALP